MALLNKTGSTLNGNMKVYINDGVDVLPGCMS